MTHMKTRTLFKNYFETYVVPGTHNINLFNNFYGGKN